MNLFFSSLLLAAFCLTARVSADFCYNDVVSACSPVGGEFQNCNAKYGAANEVVRDLQSYANTHIARNYQFLLLSTYFGNYEKNREGFSHVFRELSDNMWNKGIELIQYINKRGGAMDFKYKKQPINEVTIDNYEQYELGSLAKSLDIMKSLAEEAHLIHAEVTRKREPYHDPEVASYIENNFVHEHASVIRNLAGHTNDLKKLISHNVDTSLSVFLFDSYLKKSSIF